MSDIVERLRTAANNNRIQAERGTTTTGEILTALGCQTKEAVASMHDEAADEIIRLRSLLKDREWRDISTAPKDGTEILVVSETGGTGVMIARWIALQDFLTTSEAEECADAGMSETALETPDWFYADFVQGDRLAPDCQPTHWMPLPPPPEKENT